jgi:Flp pilus assembly protein TadG
MTTRERGQVLVESAFAFSLLVILSLGLIELSRALLTWQAVAAAAEAGARRGAVLGADAGFTLAQAEAAIQSHVRGAHAAGLDPGSFQVDAAWPQGTNAPGMTVRVTARQPFAPAIAWLPVPTEFASTAEMRILR